VQLKPWHCVCVSLLFAGSATLAQDPKSDPEFIHLQQTEIQFEIVPDIAGVSVAILAGDPGAPGIYVIRARFSPGVKTAPHYHDQDRHVTVVSGVWAFGMDDSGNCENAIPLQAGAYAMHPKGAVHFDGSCNGEVVEVQIIGHGPVKTHWVKQDE